MRTTLISFLMVLSSCDGNPDEKASPPPSIDVGSTEDGAPDSAPSDERGPWTTPPPSTLPETETLQAPRY